MCNIDSSIILTYQTHQNKTIIIKVVYEYDSWLLLFV